MGDAETTKVFDSGKAVSFPFSWINKTSDFVGKTGGYAALVLVICVMFYEVVARYVFDSPTRFALEYSIMIQMLLVSLAASYILREEGHVSIGIVVENLSEMTRHWFMVVTSIIGAMYCTLLCLTLWKL